MDLSKMSVKTRWDISDYPRETLEQAYWAVMDSRDAAERSCLDLRIGQDNLRFERDELARRLAAAEAQLAVARGWLGKTLSARLIEEAAQHPNGGRDE